MMAGGDVTAARAGADGAAAHPPASGRHEHSAGADDCRHAQLVRIADFVGHAADLSGHGRVRTDTGSVSAGRPGADRRACGAAGGRARRRYPSHRYTCRSCPAAAAPAAAAAVRADVGVTGAISEGRS